MNITLTALPRKLRQVNPSSPASGSNTPLICTQLTSPAVFQSCNPGVVSGVGSIGSLLCCRSGRVFWPLSDPSFAMSCIKAERSSTFGTNKSGRVCRPQQAEHTSRCGLGVHRAQPGVAVGASGDLSLEPDCFQSGNAGGTRWLAGWTGRQAYKTEHNRPRIGQGLVEKFGSALPTAGCMISWAPPDRAWPNSGWDGRETM